MKTLIPLLPAQVRHLLLALFQARLYMNFKSVLPVVSSTRVQWPVNSVTQQGPAPMKSVFYCISGSRWSSIFLLSWDSWRSSPLTSTTRLSTTVANTKIHLRKTSVLGPNLLCTQYLCKYFSLEH